MFLLASIFFWNFSDHEAFGALKGAKPPRSISRENAVINAVGVVDFYPFENKSRALRCNTFHLGDGYLATAGHCFLGARDCNGATVRWPNVERVSRCTKVVYSYASESVSRGNEISTDLTIFKVDFAPHEKLAFTNTIKTSEEINKNDALYLQAQLKNGRILGQMGGTCQLVTGRITNIFGQPKTPDTAIHDCKVEEFGSGSPIIDPSTNFLLAIHQSSSSVPAFEESSQSTVTLKTINFGKIISDQDVNRIIQNEDNSLQNLRVGGFSSELFNTGFSEKLDLKLATLQAAAGFETVSFIAHNGIDSLLEVAGADGQKIIFSGPRRAGYEQRFQFRAPVSVVLKSSHTGKAPSAWLEDIQSP